MKKIESVPSLLPYLDRAHTRFQLNITPATPREAGQHAFLPFAVINDQHPTSCLLDASIKTDNDNRAAHVFLLMQKSAYDLHADSLVPVGNIDIEQSWQNAFAFHQRKTAGPAIRVLNEQCGPNGSLLPFAPLFYCRDSRQFFHPPCPQCGGLLQLCDEKDVLAQYDLMPYEKSLDRYLYCPACAAGSGPADLYMLERGVNSPESIHDFNGLIAGYRAAGQSGQAPETLVCVDCQNYEKCREKEAGMSARIIPFSFYPFYAFVFEASKCNAVDFLMYLSNASMEAFDDGRAVMRPLHMQAVVQQEKTARRFIYSDTDPRLFLEILYLKLTFLSEIVQAAPFWAAGSGRDRGPCADYTLTLDQIYVDFPDLSTLLPALWHFNLRIYEPHDVTERADGEAEAAFRKSLVQLGRIWLYTLLVNRGHSIGDVFDAVEAALENEASSEGLTLDTIQAASGDATFIPENIFWEPALAVSIEADGRVFWERAVNLGLGILHAGIFMEGFMSKEDIEAALDTLRSEVHDALFDPSAAGVPETVGDRMYDGLILNILRNMREELLTGRPPGDSRASVATASDESGETIVNRSDGADTEDDIINETVVLGKGYFVGAGQSPVFDKNRDKDTDKANHAGLGGDPPGGDDGFEETVVIRKEASPSHTGVAKEGGLFKSIMGGKPPASEPEPEPEGDADAMLDATVVIRKDRKPVAETAPSSGTLPGEAAGAAAGQDESIMDGKAPASEPEPEPEGDADAMLDATVVIRKDRKPDMETAKPVAEPGEKAGLDAHAGEKIAGDAPAMAPEAPPHRTVSDVDADLDATVAIRPGATNVQADREPPSVKDMKPSADGLSGDTPPGAPEKKSDDFPSDDPDDDMLNETVIIKPKK